MLVWRAEWRPVAPPKFLPTIWGLTMAYAEPRERKKGVRYRGLHKAADGRYRSADTFSTEERALAVAREAERLALVASDAAGGLDADIRATRTITEYAPLFLRHHQVEGNTKEISAGNAMVDFVYDAEDFGAEWIVTAGERRVMLHLRLHEDFVHPPVVIAGLGPVLQEEDVLGDKVLAPVTRRDARDFVDVYPGLQRGWTREQLIGFAWQVNPHDYEAEDFTSVLAALADIEGFELERYGAAEELKDLRQAFEQWSAPKGLG